MKSTNSKINPKSEQNLRFAVLAVDVVLWTIHDGELLVRLIPVHMPPFFSYHAGLPGGLIRPTETAEEAAQRLILSKACVDPSKIYLEQLYTFSDVERDPRGRVVAVAYSGIVAWDNLSTEEREDLDHTWWTPADDLPKLAYDHRNIVKVALERLQSRVTYTTLISQFLPKEFTLTELESFYRLILGKKIDKRNFRKKISSLNILKPLSKERRGMKSRPAKLYSFRSKAVKTIEML